MRFYQNGENELIKNNIIKQILVSIDYCNYVLSCTAREIDKKAIRKCILNLSEAIKNCSKKGKIKEEKK